MTQGQIHADFAAGRLTAQQAADAVVALCPRRSRVVFVLSVIAHLAPYLLAGAGWALVIFGRSGR